MPVPPAPYCALALSVLFAYDPLIDSHTEPSFGDATGARPNVFLIELPRFPSLITQILPPQELGARTPPAIYDRYLAFG